MSTTDKPAETGRKTVRVRQLRSGICTPSDQTAALKALGRAHGDGAHPASAHMLLHFQHQLTHVTADFRLLGNQRFINSREISGVLKFNVHHRPDHLHNFTLLHFPPRFPNFTSF